MPPKVDVKTLAGKLDNAVKLLYELMEEFETIFSIKPELKTLEAAFSLGQDFRITPTLIMHTALCLTKQSPKQWSSFETCLF